MVMIVVTMKGKSKPAITFIAGCCVFVLNLDSRLAFCTEKGQKRMMSSNLLKSAVDPEALAAARKDSKRNSSRLHSLDALRGFDMFWIMGGASLIHALTKYFDWEFLHVINDQLHHVEWDGFTF